VLYIFEICDIVIVMKKQITATKPKYVIVRSREAGCFFGVLADRPTETSVVLTSASRLWYWSGAASLSQMAMEGVSNPKACKFPPAVDRQEIMGVCEILDCTDQAITSIQGVIPWRA
jgi:hypothetical protein